MCARVKSDTSGTPRERPEVYKCKRDARAQAQREREVDLQTRWAGLIFYAARERESCRKARERERERAQGLCGRWTMGLFVYVKLVGIGGEDEE